MRTTMTMPIRRLRCTAWSVNATAWGRVNVRAVECAACTPKSDICRASNSVPALRGGYVGLVTCGVGERPPGRRELVAHHPAAGGERRRNASLRLLVRHPDGEMDRAATVGAGLLHLLEPERDAPVARIDEVFGGTVATGLIPEPGPPERHHLGDSWGARDDEE